jgi:hypothetical protein
MITARLFQAAANMRQIDELFLWLANVSVQNLDVQVAQFWGLQTNRTGEVFTQLRALVFQDNSLPQHVVTNNHVVTLAGNVLNQRRGFMMQKVSNLFSPFQADLLARYGLNYCSCYFLSSALLLPPAYDPSSQGQLLPMPLALAVLLFLRQVPSQTTISALGLVLEQAIQAAGTYGLLQPPAATGNHSLRNGYAQQEPRSALPELIPHRYEDDKLLKSSNPFAGSGAITDKQARRLYNAVDGHRAVKEICEVTGMDAKEARRALKILMAQHRIQFYTPGGQLVDDSALQDVL